MSEDDILRYIEYEAPGMGVVDNMVSEVVCYRTTCDNRIEVDPHTLVVEDDDAVDVEAKDIDSANTYQIEIYCSGECRNEAYSRGEVP